MQLNRVILRMLVLLFCGLILAGFSKAEPCRTVSSFTTKFGTISTTSCGTDPTDKYLATIEVDGVSVLKVNQLFREDFSDDRSQWVFTSDEMDNETGCDSRIYLIDLTFRPVKVIAFGVKKACTEFDSVVFGPKRTVIKLKETTKFIYENGKMKLPSGPRIWNTVRPSQKDFSVESRLKAVAFSEEVPPPK